MKSLMNKVGSTFYLYLVAGLMVVFVFAAAVLLFIGGPGGTQNPPVVKVNPSDNTILVSNKKQVFVVYFKSAPPKHYAPVLSYIVATENKPATEAKIKTRYMGSGMLEISLSENIKAQSVYKLEIINKNNKQVVYSGSYLSSDVLPTPVPSNNLKLAPFLPHTENNYVLEYLKNQNIYVFNFIYDITINVGINEQVAKAKSDALQYIRAKGVDPNTLVIDWGNN